MTNTEPAQEPLQLLIVEDDPGHAYLIRACLRGLAGEAPVRHFPDGQAAWDFLSGEEASGRRLVMALDIRMPRLDGPTLLRMMKADARLAGIPVIMLTTADDPREMQACLAAGCSHYLTKPADFDQFKETIRRLWELAGKMQVAAVPRLR
jgi:CheY-like chemotaxis protein